MLFRSIELGRRLGVTQTTAWKIKTKLAEVMRIAGEKDRLEGRIEMDDAYLGGERGGGKTGAAVPARRRLWWRFKRLTRSAPDASSSGASHASSAAA